ncbi:MAG: DUF4158 domain-containing protein [Pleurocapsa sp. SU_196_0]|nr:DUF4158 domain-containing protein [Pleurocapsa sp. SU_196_0]
MQNQRDSETDIPQPRRSARTTPTSVTPHPNNSRRTSPRDYKLIQEARYPHTCLGFAVQLCTLRFLGHRPHRPQSVSRNSHPARRPTTRHPTNR